MEQPSIQHTASAFSSHQPSTFSNILKQWRDRRKLSQLELALMSQVSQRHISFLESGRAKPSQEMVLQLANVLEVPLRQQNLMLSAAGFAPIHAETDLSAPEMASICKALSFMLHQQEPYPALVIDRYWNMLLTNEGATRLLSIFIDMDRLQKLFCIDGKINLARIVLDPQGLKSFITNWEEVTKHILQRIYREANASMNEQSTLLFEELVNYPDVAEIWQHSHRTTQNDLILITQFKHNDLNLRFFSTIATLGTPYDITLQEIRIESLFPADEATERNWKSVS